MKLLLCKNVDKLGIVGDVVDVSSGYARNFLLPYGLATEPSKGNERVLAEARRVAEQERSKQRAELEALAARLVGVEITIRARANDAGVLYGSVGKKEIAAALVAEGYYVTAEHVVLAHAIGQLDNTEVDLRLAADLRTPIKLWIVREKTEEDGESSEAETVKDENKPATTGGKPARAEGKPATAGGKPARAGGKEAKDGDEAAN